MSYDFSDFDRQTNIRGQREIPWRLGLLYLFCRMFNATNPVLTNRLQWLRLQIKTQLNTLYGLGVLDVITYLNYHNSSIPRNRFPILTNGHSNRTSFYGSNNCFNTLLISATPMIDNPYEIGLLMNMLLPRPEINEQNSSYFNADFEGDELVPTREQRMTVFRGLGSSNESIEFDDIEEAPRRITVHSIPRRITEAERQLRGRSVRATSHTEYRHGNRSLYQSSNGGGVHLYNFALYPDRYQPSLIFGNITSLYSNSYSFANKALFHFHQNQNMSVDLKKDGLFYIFDQIKKYPGSELRFETISENSRAYGDGANRQFYLKLCNEMVNTIMAKTHPYFMDINLENEFWNNSENIKVFVEFLAMTINSNCVLPYHLPLALLECISYKKMNITDLEFFMEKIEPDLYKETKKVGADFAKLDIGYDTLEEYYRNRVIGSMSERKLEIYQKIAEGFQMFDSFHDYDILTIDKLFAGSYTISAEQVLNIINLNNTEYGNMWTEFVKSLSEAELKKMLIVFGNSL